MAFMVPPSTDELIARHQYYSHVAGEINSNAKDIDGIGKRLSRFAEIFETVKDDVRSASIRNKTLISAAVVVWAIIGSAITVYIQRGLDTFDKSNQRIESLERKINNLETVVESNKNLPDRVTALTRKYDEMQRKIDEVERPKK